MTTDHGLLAAAPRTGAVATHCPYCSLQCGITLQTDGRAPASPAVTLAPQADFPTNRGNLCSKGWSAAELLDHPDRLTTPLVRDSRGEPLRPTSWDDALGRIAAAFRAAQAGFGNDAVGIFGGGGLTNEKAYSLGKFARVTLRTAMIDYNGRFCMSSAANAANRAFGIDRGLPFPLSDLADADAVLFVGSNPADTLPPAMQFLDAARERGARHIVVDPRVTATARTAHLHLQPVPGTDLALANGMLNVAIRESLTDDRYIAERTSGFEAVRRAVRMYWPDRVERITGVPEADLVRAVRLLAAAPRAMILTARGAEQHSSGTDTVSAYVNVALALGLPGRPASGFGTITGQGNGQGGREHGQKSDQLPGYRRLDDPVARAHDGDVQVDESAQWYVPGVPYAKPELMDKIRELALHSVSSVFAALAPDGAEDAKSKMGLASLLEMMWAEQYVDERDARFINDRVHANIQRDGTFSVIPQMKGGVTDASARNSAGSESATRPRSASGSRSASRASAARGR